ncbi:transmembrane protein 253 isoform X2 [Takifugu rubripes]|uniref:transmembrane protein 253 isoform X2 n=1 Tax=Takifugu rubripes TaxID=31033 RepID=UPI001145B1B2|nr:uncharacterized protein LOC101063205 isoform X2 [Takifugu rubripes]
MVRKDRPAKMTQNMFQEGLYHVFFKDSPRTSTKASSSSPLTNARIHRWFGTVVNTRLLVSGFMAAGCLAVEVQRKANKLKIIGLMGLNVFSLLFGFSALLANSLVAKQPVALSTDQQRVGSYVAKGSSVTFTVKCFLASIYILFISWRGLQRYSTPVIQVYSQISQDPDGPLLEDEELDL